MNTLIIGTNGHVSSINQETGETIWTTKISTGALISATSRQDVSVVRSKNLVFAGSAGHVFCLDASSGRVLWHNTLKGLGNNDVSMALEGISIQYLSKEVHHSST